MNTDFEITDEPQQVPYDLQDFYKWVDILKGKNTWSIPTIAIVESMVKFTELEPRESQYWTSSDKLVRKSVINGNVMDFPYAESHFIEGDNYEFALPLLVENGLIGNKQIQQSSRKPAFGHSRSTILFPYYYDWKIEYDIYNYRKGNPALRPVQSIKVQW